MSGAAVGLRMPHTHEIFTASVREKRHWPIGLVFNDAQIFPLRIDWPGLHFGESVSSRETHGVFDSRIVPRLHSGVVPPVEAMTHIAPVVQSYVLFQNGRPGTQNQLYGPLHPVHTISIADRDGGAAVGMSTESEIYRRHRYPIMRNREVKLDAKCRPGTAISNVCFFQGRVGIKHREAIDLVHAGVDVPTDIR